MSNGLIIGILKYPIDRVIKKFSILSALICVFPMGMSGILNADVKPTDTPSYTLAQADQGKLQYQKHCAKCHGENLKDGRFGTPLVGDLFYGIWGGQSVKDLLAYTEANMPLLSPGELSRKEYLEIFAYMFKVSGFPSSKQPLASSSSQLATIKLPIPPDGLIKVDVQDSLNWSKSTSKSVLNDLSLVTDSMLEVPPAEDWLMWRRTYDAKGYSPLDIVNSSNVKNLKLAWAWTMPSGRNTSTPLVHGGVVFMHGYGDFVQALDVETGDLLWQYNRGLKDGIRVGLRAIALYEDKVIVPTKDSSIIALNMKTGDVVWDKKIFHDSTLLGLSSGPLLADGKIIIGTVSHTQRNFIIAIDANTGEELWRFHTVAQADDPGGDTWNGIGPEERQGAGVWVPGSYDPELKLAYFGTANTYKPEKLRHLAPGAVNNNGLYLDSTLALNIDTGDLEWHYQHLKNDQWNHDWAFERTITQFDIKGLTRKAVFTGGKQGVFDALEAKNGSYLFSVDMGLQNIISYIDPISGEKTLTPEAIPKKGETSIICPSQTGARLWMPTSLTDNNVLYIPFRESCMLMRSPLAGDSRLGEFGFKAIPRPDSDGNYGGLQAIDLNTKEPLWTYRHRSPPTTGALATAGGVVFTGFFDRVFAAFDHKTGKELWQVRLNGVPSAAPISFMVDDKQYIAVITGNGNFIKGLDTSFIAPGVRNPNESNATIWVFKIDDG